MAMPGRTLPIPTICKSILRAFRVLRYTNFCLTNIDLARTYTVPFLIPAGGGTSFVCRPYTLLRLPCSLYKSGFRCSIRTRDAGEPTNLLLNTVFEFAWFSIKFAWYDSARLSITPGP
jgi:hypothetical protein